MSVQSEINRISENVASTYEALEEQGATLPTADQQTSDNLASTVMTISSGAQTVTTSGSGSAYTATVKGITALTPGVNFIMIPHVISASASPTLNVNGLGAKPLRQPLSQNTSSYASGSLPTWISANRPVQVMYDGYAWKVNVTRPSATGLYGTVPITSGGTGATTAEQALTNLGGASKTYVDEQIALLLQRIEALENA